MTKQEANKDLSVWKAGQIWRKYGFSKPGEPALEDLAFTMGVLVIDERLDKSEARLVRKGTKGIIRVKSDISEQGRRRFAIGHELGHWVLHKDVSQVFSCTSEDMVALYKASPVEIEANYFAAELLMPSGLYASMMSDTVLCVEVTSDLARQFQTSLTASIVRYVELSSEYCALVVSKDGRVCWWRKSSAWGSTFWLDRRSQLSKWTVAGGLATGETLPSTAQEVALSAWIDNTEAFEEDVIIEEAVVMRRYGQVLSLLRVP